MHVQTSCRQPRPSNLHFSNTTAGLPQSQVAFGNCTALTGYRLWCCARRCRFTTFPEAALCLFRLMNGGGTWQTIPQLVTQFNLTATVFFLCFSVIANYVSLNFFIVIVLSKFGLSEAELDEQRKKRDHAFMQQIKRTQARRQSMSKGDLVESEPKRALSDTRSSQLPLNPVEDRVATNAKHTNAKHEPDSASSTQPNATRLRLPLGQQIRGSIKSAVRSNWFEGFIVVGILISSGVLLFDNPRVLPVSRGGMLPATDAQAAKLADILETIDIVFIVIFSLEALLKVVAFLPRGYLRDGWNVFDLAVLAVTYASLIGTGSSIGRVLRIGRILRPLRMIRRNEGMRVIINALLASLPSVGYTVMLVSVCFFVFAILGVSLFKGLMWQCNDANIPNEALCIGVFVDGSGILKPRVWLTPSYNFDNIGTSFTTLLRVVTLKGWTSVLDALMDATSIGKQPSFDASPWSSIFLVVFIMLGSMYLMKLFVGVIVSHFRQFSGTALLTKAQRDFLALKRALELVRPPAFTDTANADVFVSSPSATAQRIPGGLPRASSQMSSDANDTIDARGTRLPAQLSIAALHMDTVAKLNERTAAQFRKYKRLRFVFGERSAVTVVTAHMLMLTLLIALPRAAAAKFEPVAVALHWLAFVYYIGSWCLRCFEDLTKLSFSWFSWSTVELFTTLLMLLAPVLPPGQSQGLYIGISRSIRWVEALQHAAWSPVQMKRAIVVIGGALPAILNITSLLSILLFVFSVMGMQVFATTRRGTQLSHSMNYDSFGQAMFSLFRIISGENWLSLYDDCALDSKFRCSTFSDGRSDCGSGALAFIFYFGFFVMSFAVFLNLFVAAILDSFTYTVSSGSSASLRLTDQDVSAFQSIWLACSDPSNFHATLRVSQVRRFLGLLQEIEHPLMPGVEYLTRPELLWRAVQRNPVLKAGTVIGTPTFGQLAARRLCCRHLQRSPQPPWNVEAQSPEASSVPEAANDASISFGALLLLLLQESASDAEFDVHDRSLRKQHRLYVQQFIAAERIQRYWRRLQPAPRDKPSAIGHWPNHSGRAVPPQQERTRAASSDSCTSPSHVPVAVRAECSNESEPPVARPVLV